MEELSTLLENQSIFNNGKVSIFRCRTFLLLAFYLPISITMTSTKNSCYWTVRSILKKPQMRGVYSLKDVRPRWAMGAHFCVPWLKWWSFHNGLGVLRWGDMDCKVDGILLLQARTNWCSKFSVARTWQIVFGVTSSIIIFWGSRLEHSYSSFFCGPIDIHWPPKVLVNKKRTLQSNDTGHFFYKAIVEGKAGPPKPLKLKSPLALQDEVTKPKPRRK